MPTVAAFSEYVLAVHILGAVVAFGVTFAYPVFLLVGLRQDPSAAPWFHRMQAAIGRRIINPGLAVVVIAGLILAADEHQWKSFYVQWGIGVALVIGALEGAVMIPSAKRLAGLAETDLQRGGGPSPEYAALLRRTTMLGALLVLIVVVTVFLMATHAGATT